MLVHLRVTVPTDRSDAVRALFQGDGGVAHLAVLPGGSLQPPGDLYLADVARECADGLIAGLRDLGVDEVGGIAIEAVDAAVSRPAERAEELAPGDGADAVVWEQVVRTTDADSSLSMSFFAFLTIATLLAMVAIVNDSAVLLIGATVLGPEFAPLAAVAVSLVARRPNILRRALISLAAGFTVAIAVTTLVALAMRGLGWFGPELLEAARPATGFITRPDRWSVVVAVLAGVAGVLSLTSAKSGALVGVFISVTTVPAAGDMALSLALGGADEFWSATVQLVINLVGIVLAAIATLAAQRASWRRVPRVVPKLEHVGRDS